MCLSPEFFDYREQAIREARDCGEIELDEFIRLHSLDTQTFHDQKYIRLNEYFSTAEILHLRLTPRGNYYLRHDQAAQAIFVRSNRSSALLAKIESYRSECG